MEGTENNHLCHMDCDEESLGDRSLGDLDNIQLASPPVRQKPQSHLCTLDCEEDSTSHNPSGTVDDLRPTLFDDSYTCEACNGPKKGPYIYYGGKVCKSCRAFFRRAVVTGTYVRFRCRFTRGEEYKCPVESKSRRCCQLCRFNACTRVGMKTNYVLSEQQIVQRSKKKQTTVPAVERDLFGAYTKEELLTVRAFVSEAVSNHHHHLVKVLASCCSQLMVRALSDGQPLCRAILDNMAVGTLGYLDCQAESLAVRAGLVPDPGDLRAVIRANFPVVLNLILALFVNPVDAGVLIKSLVCHVKDEKVRSILQDDKELASTSQEIRLDQVLRKGWQQNRTSELSHKSILERISRWLPRGLAGDNASSDSFDRTAFHLLFLVTLFSADSVDLANRDPIEKIQLNYATMLQRYIKHLYQQRVSGEERTNKYSSASKLGEGLLLLSSAREGWEMMLGNKGLLTGFSEGAKTRIVPCRDLGEDCCNV